MFLLNLIYIIRQFWGYSAIKTLTSFSFRMNQLSDEVVEVEVPTQTLLRSCQLHDQGW